MVINTISLILSPSSLLKHGQEREVSCLYILYFRTVWIWLFFWWGGEGGLKVPSNFVLRKMRKCSRKVEKNCICIWGSGLFPLQSLVCFQLFFFFSSSSFSPFPCVVFLISIKTNKQKTPKNKNKKHGGLMVLHTFKGS